MLPKSYIEGVVKTIKKTNMRITRLAKQFGTDSAVYKSQISSIQKVIDSKFLHENTRGELQISSTLAKNLSSINEARKTGYAMGKVKTVKQTRDYYIEKLGLDSSDVDMSNEEMQKMFDEKAEELDKIYSNFQNAMSKFYKEVVTSEEETKDMVKEVKKKLKDRGSKRRLTVEELEDITGDLVKINKKYKELQDKRIEEARRIRDDQPWSKF